MRTVRNAAAARNPKAAKKNIWKLGTLMPACLIVLSTVSFFTPELTNSTHKLPTVTDKFQNAMIDLRLFDRGRSLAVGKLKARCGNQNFAERQARIGQNLPGDGKDLAILHRQLHGPDADRGHASERDAGSRAQGGRLNAGPAKHGIKDQVVERDQQHHQQRVEPCICDS